MYEVSISEPIVARSSGEHYLHSRSDSLIRQLADSRPSNLTCESFFNRYFSHLGGER